jgi:hypothetical protein
MPCQRLAGSPDAGDEHGGAGNVRANSAMNGIDPPIPTSTSSLP